MATDHSHDARIGIVNRLINTPSITNLVGDRVYGEKVPANPIYPFIRVGLMISTPYSPWCVSGMQASFNIDCVSTNADAGQAYSMAKQVIDTLHTKFFPLGAAAHVAALRWERTTPRQEDKLWRMMVGFKLTTQQA